jgi:hypothetical protein
MRRIKGKDVQVTLLGKPITGVSLGDASLVYDVEAWEKTALVLPAPSTRRRPSWEPVEKGDMVSVPVEGGFVGERAPERGVRLKVEGSDSVYIPESMIAAVMAHLMKKVGK